MSGRRERDRQLGRHLQGVVLPSEDEAEERAREVVLAAYESRTPIRPAPRTRRIAAAIAGGAVLLAIGLSPAGAKMGELVEEVVDTGREDAKPALRSLPAPGELLVESEQGVWIVRADGSKRLLGDYEEASWSPRGRFVVATDGEQLVALEPEGAVQWTVTPGGEIRDPRWGGVDFDTRIAYRSGDDLRVVAGDGSGDRPLASDVAPVAPAWQPVPDAKLLVPGDPGVHPLAYVDGDGAIRLVDVDTGSELWRSDPIAGGVKSIEWTSNGRRLVVLSDRTVTVLGGDGRFRFSSTADAAGAALSPTGGRLALIAHRHGRTQITAMPTTLNQRAGLSGKPFSIPGRIGTVFWSPNGEWLLLPWRDADQWLFVDPERPSHPKRVDNISQQFDPGGSGRAEFPRVSGWILPER